MTHATATPDLALSRAVCLINSLGGEPLPLGADRDTLRVILANQAATNVPHWMLDSVRLAVA